MRAIEIHISALYRDPEDYDIPFAPVDVDENGEKWIECENPVKVRR
jgi:hypothetical protein